MNLAAVLAWCLACSPGIVPPFVPMWAVVPPRLH
jgi:hypothetical protein